MVLKEEGQLTFATRKDSPQLRQLLDEFVQGRQMGTSFGNTLIRRYLQNTKWVRDATSSEEMKKFQEYVRYFQKYAAEYDFDYLMLIAQGYQESLLDQSKKNRSGAVGIMQVIPKYAAAPPISIPNVDSAQYNIQAGDKMLRNIAETYFKDDKLDATNKTLMVFASYNAGPNQIVRLRKKAAEEGLDPNQWFGNVELVAAKDVGQETTLRNVRQTRTASRASAFYLSDSLERCELAKLVGRKEYLHGHQNGYSDHGCKRRSVYRAWRPVLQSAAGAKAYPPPGA